MTRAALFVAALALVFAGCASAPPSPSSPSSGERQRVPRVFVSPEPARPVEPGRKDALVTAADRVSRSATRWLYAGARGRDRVHIAPATSRFRRALGEIHIPAALRGEDARVEDLSAVEQTPDTALVSWTVVDSRARFPIAVTMVKHGGRWRAEEHNGD